MTAAARIIQADMDRAVKAVKNGGFDRARIVIDLEQGRIEIIIGESDSIQPSDQNPWDNV